MTERFSTDQSGDVYAREASQLIERVKNGGLDPVRLQWAASLGDPAARATGAQVIEIDPEAFVWDAAGLLSLKEQARFALSCVERALAAWTAVFPNDGRPSRAAERIRSWIQGNNVPADEFRSLSEQLDDLGDAVEAESMHAASAARAVADAVRIPLGGPDPPQDLVDYVATKARRAISSPAELAVQRAMLARILLS